ncbi:MAG: SpoVG family protein [Candidatus Goldbacteria bacterium]|nr:SpoVG family protein [Candidatus Goldiibacteriota bacterium]
MEITNVKIYPTHGKDEKSQKLKAYAAITFNDSFIVRGLKVIEGSKGFFVVMPSRKLANGMYKDVAHPLNNEIRKKIEQKVLEKFYEMRQKNDTRAQ